VAVVATAMLGEKALKFGDAGVDGQS